MPDSFGVGLFGSSIATSQFYAIGDNLSWGGISVTNPGGLQTIGSTTGQILTLGSSGIAMGTATANLTIQADVFLGRSQSWVVGIGRTLTVSGAVSGDFGSNLTKSGPGTLLLSGANTFFGNTNITDGNLTLGADNALPASTVVAIGGTGTPQLVLAGFSQTIGGLTTLTGGTRRVIGNSASLLSVLTINTASGASYTYAGQVGNGTNANPNRIAVVKSGGGLQELTNTTSLTYTGNTTIQDGALGFAVGNGALSSFLILDGGVFQSQGTAPLTFTRNIGTAGGSSFQWTGNGGGFSAKGAKFTVNVGGAQAALNWGTSVETDLTGTLKFGHSTATAETEFQNPIKLNGSNRTISVADNLTSNADFATLSGVISDGSGPAGIIKTGLGTLVLSANNSYTGITTIREGTLATNAPVSLPGYNTSGRVIVEAGGTLQTRIGGAGEWQVSDVETLLGTVSFQPGATLALDTATSNVTLNTALTLSSLKLGKVGSGTLLLTGNNTYTGGTEISGGTLQLGSNGVLGTGPITFSGGTLSSSDSSPRTIANPVLIHGATSFGDVVNNGALILEGTIDFGSTIRNIATSSDVTFSGALSNGGLGQKTGPGTLTIKADADWTLGGPLEIREGALVIDGADITNADALRVMATTPGSTARVEIKNGSSFTILKSTGNFRVGYSPGGDSSATNIADISGSVLFTPGGSGGAVQMGTSSGKAILNLKAGGLIATKGVTTGPNPLGETEANFDGGTLKAIQNGSNLIQNLTHAYIKAGGLIVDSNGFDINIPQSLEHDPLLGGTADGGFTKTGLGTVTLGGINTFDGPTNINEGTLFLTGSIAGRAVNVNNGGTLSGWGTLVASGNSSINVAAGGIVAPGLGIGTLNVVTSGGQFNLSEALAGTATGALNFELGYGLGDSITLTGGAFNIGTGVLAFDDFIFSDGGGITQGTYTLLDSNTPIVGQLDLAHLSGSVGSFTGTLGFADNGNDLILTVVPEPNAALLVLAGTAGLLGSRRRRSARQ